MNQGFTTVLRCTRRAAKMTVVSAGRLRITEMIRRSFQDRSRRGLSRAGKPTA